LRPVRQTCEGIVFNKILADMVTTFYGKYGKYVSLAVLQGVSEKASQWFFNNLQTTGEQQVFYAVLL
jgi:hypothetical protein